MAVIIPDLERELFARISPYQPALAVPLAQRLSALPAADVAQILASEAALVEAIDLARAREQRERKAGPSRVFVSSVTASSPMRQAAPPKIYRCLQGTSTKISRIEEPAAAPRRLLEEPGPLSRRVLEEQSAAAKFPLLASRVARVEPEMVNRITDKILDLGQGAVDDCMLSDSALQQHVSSVLGAIVREETGSKSRIPRTVYRGIAAVSPCRPASVERVTAGAARSISPDFRALSSTPRVLPTTPRGIPTSPLVEPVADTLRPMRSASPDRRGQLLRSALAGEPPVPTADLRATPRNKASITRCHGLEEFMAELGLSHYMDLARDWVESMGAFLLEEVIENRDSFADALGLRPLERTRLHRHGPDVAAGLARSGSVVR